MSQTNGTEQKKTLDQRESEAIQYLVEEKNMSPKDAKVYVLQMIQVLGPVEFDQFVKD